jgi:hypothetical protein
VECATGVSKGSLDGHLAPAFRGWLPAAVAALGFLLLWSGSASASQLFARDATAVKLAVNASGKALLTYKINGATRHLLVSGAVNALPPSRTTPQVKFNMTQLGPRGKDKKVWAKFKNKCTSYDGPALAFVVVACKAPDGSYWAVQSWQYWFPFFGYQPWLPYQDDVAFHVSHWTGPLAQIEMWASWIDVGRGASAPHDVIARVSYGGSTVFGYVVKPGGVPGDGYGRVVYIESLDSLFGAGWSRITGILARNPSGMVCHSMIPQMAFSNYPNPHEVDPGPGKAYRAYTEGPGVTPLVLTEVQDPGNYDPKDLAKVERQANARSLLNSWGAPPACLAGH